MQSSGVHSGRFGMVSDVLSDLVGCVGSVRARGAGRFPQKQGQLEKIRDGCALKQSRFGKDRV